MHSYKTTSLKRVLKSIL